MMLRSTSGAVALTAILLAACSPADTSSPAEAAEDHFHPKGKPPSEHTIRVLQEARTGLPFDDDRDFEEYQ